MTWSDRKVLEYTRVKISEVRIHSRKMPSKNRPVNEADGWMECEIAIFSARAMGARSAGDAAAENWRSQATSSNRRPSTSVQAGCRATWYLVYIFNFLQKTKANGTASLRWAWSLILTWCPRSRHKFPRVHVCCFSFCSVRNTVFPLIEPPPHYISSPTNSSRSSNPTKQ